MSCQVGDSQAKPRGARPSLKPRTEGFWGLVVLIALPAGGCILYLGSLGQAAQMESGSPP